MDPIDFSRSGSAHSHPGFSAEASDEDLDTFRHMGGVHFITCEPYDRKSWRVYDSNGEEIHLPMFYGDGTQMQ